MLVSSLKKFKSSLHGTHFEIGEQSRFFLLYAKLDDILREYTTLGELQKQRKV